MRKMYTWKHAQVYRTSTCVYALVYVRVHLHAYFQACTARIELSLEAWLCISPKNSGVIFLLHGAGLVVNGDAVRVHLFLQVCGVAEAF